MDQNLGFILDGVYLTFIKNKKQMKHNFSAGPCILPQEVLTQAADAVINFNNLGLSLIEISHRSKDFVDVMEKARSIVKKLMGLSDDYEALFLQGGASLQFIMTAYNLLPQGGKASYLDTGAWSSKAIKEAKRFGDIDVVASSKDENYIYIPKGYSIPDDSSYFHCTSNNTIHGTQIKEFPKSFVPMVCDMSSDIFSRELDFSSFDMIYAGAQKNMGPAGTTLVVVKKELLGKTGRNIPAYLDYEVHIDKDSIFNTPSVFAVYTSLLTLEWMERNGGVAGTEKRNNAKAELLYKEIDRNPIFSGTSKAEDRSYMNVPFVLTNEEMKDEFERKCTDTGISGIKGHRSVGGYRASLYNALPIESVQVLVDIMKECEK